SQRDWRIVRYGDGYAVRAAFAENGQPKNEPDTSPLTALPDLRGTVGLNIAQSEVGQFVLYGQIGWEAIGTNGKPHSAGNTGNNYFAGTNPAVGKLNNAAASVRLAGDRDLQPPVTIRPEPSCRCVQDPNSADHPVPEPRATTADVLETLHRATGLPIVADYYTRLYPIREVSANDLPLFDALNHLSDGMRLRWHKDGSWIQFRSVTYYAD